MSDENGNDANYQVGYGKPPQNTRFKKGTSGNPGGRPKGSRSFESLYEELYSKTLRELKVTKDTNVKEAIAIKGVQLMLQGRHNFALATGAFKGEIRDDDGPKEIEVTLLLEEQEVQRWRAGDVDPFEPTFLR